MNTTPITRTATTRTATTRPRIVAVFATAAATIIVAGSAAATTTTDSPPWSVCAYAHHPVAADIGPLLPGTMTVPLEVKALLLGQTTVGTDCSIYDLPV